MGTKFQPVTEKKANNFRSYVFLSRPVLESRRVSKCLSLKLKVLVRQTAKVMCNGSWSFPDIVYNIISAADTVYKNRPSPVVTGLNVAEVVNYCTPWVERPPRPSTYTLHLIAGIVPTTSRRFIYPRANLTRCSVRFPTCTRSRDCIPEVNCWPASD